MVTTNCLIVTECNTKNIWKVKTPWYPFKVAIQQVLLLYSLLTHLPLLSICCTLSTVKSTLVSSWTWKCLHLSDHPDRIWFCRFSVLLLLYGCADLLGFLIYSSLWWWLIVQTRKEPNHVLPIICRHWILTDPNCCL